MPLIQPQTPQQPVENQPVGRRERGTGFTNIQRLLGANVGAGQKMGSAIGQSLGAKAGKLSEDVTRAGKAFQDRYADSTRKQEEAFKVAEGLIPSSVEGISGESGLGSMDEETAKSIGKQLAEAKTYQGPMGIEGASQLASRGASLAGLGQLARGGAYGQGLLLQGTAGRTKPYTRGQSSLDAFLLGQSKEAQKDIKQAAAQTAGAEQKAQTIASGAEQQAQEGSGALSARGADILKKAAESGESISKYGKEQADKYIDDASRLADIFSKAGQVNPQTGEPLLASLSPEDIALLNRAEEFGIDTQDVFVDPRARYSNLSKDVLKGIAGGADLVKGGLKLTGEQSKAMKNLALLQQQAAPEISEFQTDRFTGNIGDQIQALQDEQKQASQELGAQEVQNLLRTGRIPGSMTYDQLTKYADISDRYHKLFGGKTVPTNAEVENIYNEIVNLFPGQYRTPTSSFHYNPLDKGRLESVKQSMNKYDQEKLAQKGVNIKDYIKSLYGINS